MEVSYNRCLVGFNLMLVKRGSAGILDELNLVLRVTGFTLGSAVAYNITKYNKYIQDQVGAVTYNIKGYNKHIPSAIKSIVNKLK